MKMERKYNSVRKTSLLENSLLSVHMILFSAESYMRRANGTNPQIYTAQ
jgi:hypothetical protein